MDVDISLLYSYEGSAVQSSLNHQAEQINGGKSIAPVKIVCLNGFWLVVDGTHRVLAAKLAGHQQIKAIQVWPQDYSQRQAYLKTLQYRIEHGQKGFDGFPVDSNSSERAKRTTQEMKEMGFA